MVDTDTRVPAGARAGAPPGRPARIPGRPDTVRVTAGMLAWYALTGAVTARLARGAGGTAAVAFFLALVPPLLLAVLACSAGRRARRLLRALSTATRRGGPLPPEATRLLAARGVRGARVRIEGGRVRSRCHRIGDRAWIVLAERHAARREAGRFVLAHELAHLLRNDAFTGRLCLVLAIGLLDGAMVSRCVPAAVVGVAGALLLSVGRRWCAELACDTAAAHWAGAAAAAAWRADTRALWAEPDNRRPARRIRRALLGWLTHPPLRVRAWWLPLPDGPSHKTGPGHRGADRGLRGAVR